MGGSSRPSSMDASHKKHRPHIKVGKDAEEKNSCDINTKFTTWHADRQDCENGQETSDRDGNEALDNVLHFEYLGSQLQGNGEDEVDVRHCKDVAQATLI